MAPAMMTKSELLALIANGENSGVEFRGDELRPEQLAQEIVALANFRGGRILLGVEDDGTITGLQRPDPERWVMDTVLGRYVHPMIMPLYEEIQIDEQHRVAVVTVDQGVSKPYVLRHDDREDIYIRIGSTTRLATREQRLGLFVHGGLLQPESLPVLGSSLADLSRDRLRDYFVRILGEQELPADGDAGAWGEYLGRRGFMVEREDARVVCTIAGLVLFGHRPRRLLPQAGVRWMAFEGLDMDYKALDDQVLDGPLVALGYESAGADIAEDGLLERLVNAMRPFVSEESNELDGFQRRQRSWEYPVEALREAIVNAFAHRDWTRNEEIRVVRYANRLEILSPGALQDSMTVEKMMTGMHSSRNILIFDVLRNYGYVDAKGMGVRRKIVPLLREHNGTEPEFDATDDYLNLALWRNARTPC